MKSKNPLICVGILAVGLASCGWLDKKKDDAATAIDKDLDPKLVGTWECDCEKVDFLGIKYRKIKLDMNLDRTFVRESTIFDNSDCQGEATVEKQTGHWTAADQNGNEGRQINFHMEKSFLDPRNGDMTKIFNGLNYCGIGDWQERNFREITGASCISAFKPDQEVQDIYQVSEDKRLYFGESGFLLTDDKGASRPENLDRGRYYQKK